MSMRSYEYTELSVQVTSPIKSLFVSHPFTSAKRTVLWFLTGSKLYPSLHSIIAATMQAQAEQLAESVFSSNALFKKLDHKSTPRGPSVTSHGIFN